MNVNSHTVTDQLRVNFAVVIDRFVHANPPAFRKIFGGSGGVCVMGGNSQPVRHQVLYLLGRCLAVGHRKHRAGHHAFDVLYKLQNTFPLRSHAPHPCCVFHPLHNLHVIPAFDFSPPGIGLPLAPKVRVQVGTFHVIAGNIGTFSGFHRLVYDLYVRKIFVLVEVVV